MSRRPKRLTAEVVARIQYIATLNPDLGLRQIGYHFTPPISHDTVGKVLRGERGVTIGPDGRMLKHGGGKPRVIRPRCHHCGHVMSSARTNRDCAVPSALAQDARGRESQQTKTLA
jgi:hypothetical protein